MKTALSTSVIVSACPQLTQESDTTGDLMDGLEDDEDELGPPQLEIQTQNGHEQSVENNNNINNNNINNNNNNTQNNDDLDLDMKDVKPDLEKTIASPVVLTKRNVAKKRKVVRKKRNINNNNNSNHIYDSDEERLKLKFTKKTKSKSKGKGEESDSDAERGPYVRSSQDSQSHTLKNPKSYSRLVAKIEDSNWNRVPIPKDHPMVEGPWLCALCQLRTGREGLGDLFGPFYLLVGQNGALIPPFFDPDSVPSTSKRASKYEGDCPNAPSHNLPKSDSPSTSRGKMSKCSSSLPTTFYIDVYLHAECLLWTPGLFMNGCTEVTGLNEHMTDYWNQRCVRCKMVGASVSCVIPKCNTNYHFHCATAASCTFVEDNISVYCPKHNDVVPSTANTNGDLSSS